MKVAFDFDGTITSHPHKLRAMAESLRASGCHVVVLTAAAGELSPCDRPAEVTRRLAKVGFTCYDELACVEGRAKGAWCRDNAVDLIIDDDSGYMAYVRRESPNTLRLQVLNGHRVQFGVAEVLHLSQELPGWCDEAKARYLIGAALAYKLRRFVEIGVYGGRSFIPAAWAVEQNGGEAWGVDPYSQAAATEGWTSGHRDWWAAVDLAQIKAACQAGIAAAGLQRSRIIEQTSQAALATLPGPIDLLHIDGNHSAAAALADMAWLDRLAPGGVVVFDDVNWPSTQGAVQILRQRLGAPIHAAETWAAWRRVA